MRNTAEGGRARPRRRPLAAIVLTVVVGLMVSALPAWGHASFPAYSGFGFAPNPTGGTGEVGSTPPYAADAVVDIQTRVPFEQTEPYNGSDDTTVDVKIVVPDGWSDPSCGTARVQRNDDTTNFTNQPGAEVAGWDCEVYSTMGRQVIHFWGPQVEAPATAAASPYFFGFSVRTPQPAAQTTYDGTGGTEGFIVDQTYASGEIEHWIPNAAFVGSPPPGSNTVVATGLRRTVAAYVAPTVCGDEGAGPFADVSGTHVFCEDIDWISSAGIADGFPDGSYRPGRAVTRQAMASFLYKYAGEPEVTLGDPYFADVAESHPFYDAIQWMAESGLSTGTPQPTGKPLYKPSDAVSRQAMAAFLYRFAGEPGAPLRHEGHSFADVTDEHAFFTEIEWMAESGLSAGTPQPDDKPLYKPSDAVARQAMAAFLHRFADLP